MPYFDAGLVLQVGGELLQLVPAGRGACPSRPSWPGRCGSRGRGSRRTTGRRTTCRPPRWSPRRRRRSRPRRPGPRASGRCRRSRRTRPSRSCRPGSRRGSRPTAIALAILSCAASHGMAVTLTSASGLASAKSLAKSPSFVALGAHGPDLDRAGGLAVGDGLALALGGRRCPRRARRRPAPGVSGERGRRHGDAAGRRPARGLRMGSSGGSSCGWVWRVVLCADDQLGGRGPRGRGRRGCGG